MGGNRLLGAIQRLADDTDCAGPWNQHRSVCVYGACDRPGDEGGRRVLDGQRIARSQLIARRRTRHESKYALLERVERHHARIDLLLGVQIVLILRKVIGRQVSETIVVTAPGIELTERWLEVLIVRKAGRVL